MKTRLKQGFTLIELLVVITIIAILASLAVPTFAKVQEKGNQTKGISNCKQIITTLKLYSSDNQGIYPDSDPSDPQSANEAFRLMFIGGQCNNEMIFGCPASPFNGDGAIGTPGTNTEAVAEGENHWAMMSGSGDSSSGSEPIVFENPVTDGPPPSWDADKAGKAVKGRSWGGGRIIVGLNDTSVSLLPLVAAVGQVGLKNTELFSPNGTPISGDVLPILEGGGTGTP